jgi:hypothetical protein
MQGGDSPDARRSPLEQVFHGPWNIPPLMHEPFTPEGPIRPPGGAARRALQAIRYLARVLQYQCMLRQAGMDRNNGLKERRARSGDTRVVVVERGGTLMAIVEDKYRGTVRIPLGTVDPRPSLAR